ncbi:MAG: helix-turn-helix transcriptional regulator [Peptostreptococcaceae bacterium]|nr:helix-turn-helix transcriptional regulator [Peptostreptococcaceae bacterium]
MDQEKIGLFLSTVRKEKGFTQEQLAEKLGVSQRSVSRWETGKSMPDYSLLPIICEVVEINVAELLNAKRIDGESVAKNDVTNTAHTMISLMNNKKSIRKLIGAVLALILTVVCMVALYNYEFNVIVDSTTDLEQAINEYHFNNEMSANILERKAIGNKLYVLYGQNNHLGASGLACLEKGILGNYRFIRCENTDYLLISVRQETIGKKSYAITFCANELPGVDSYEVYGINYANENQNLAIDGSGLIYSAKYIGSPFLEFTEIGREIAISPLSTKLYKGKTEVSWNQLEAQMNRVVDEGAVTSSYGTAELGLFYAFEIIIFILGVVFIRYFLFYVLKKEGR